MGAVIALLKRSVQSFGADKCATLSASLAYRTIFALGRPALPVDTHVYRVSRRLGLIDAKVTAEQAHALLEAQVPPEDVYAFHVALIKHGRHTCTARNPACGACPLNDVCPSAFRAAPLAAPDPA